MLHKSLWVVAFGAFWNAERLSGTIVLLMIAIIRGRTAEGYALPRLWRTRAQHGHRCFWGNTHLKCTSGRDEVARRRRIGEKLRRKFCRQRLRR